MKLQLQFSLERYFDPDLHQDDYVIDLLLQSNSFVGGLIYIRGKNNAIISICKHNLHIQNFLLATSSCPP